MTSKSGRYKPGARSVSRSVKLDKLKRELEAQENKCKAEAAEKAAEEKGKVDRLVVEAGKAQKILEDKCKLAEENLRVSQKYVEAMKTRVAETLKERHVELVSLKRRADEYEQAYERSLDRRVYLDKQVLKILADNEVLQCENSSLKIRLSQLSPAASPY
jgi:regulator of replication initiation timing